MRYKFDYRMKLPKTRPEIIRKCLPDRIVKCDYLNSGGIKAGYSKLYFEHGIILTELEVASRGLEPTQYYRHMKNLFESHSLVYELDILKSNFKGYDTKLLFA